MLRGMSNRLATAVLAALAIFAAPALASGTPSKAKIRSAVHSAEHSSQLWATIDICNTPHHRDMVGMRGQMPALGFSSTMVMKFSTEFRAGKHFIRDNNPNTTQTVSAGSASSGTTQRGWTFKFAPHAGLLRGLVTFEWKLGKKTIGSTSRTTTAGHKGVASADPAGYSSATCRIK
jgi:hypothetical protein